jgi:hypothetical protein
VTNFFFFYFKLQLIYNFIFRSITFHTHKYPLKSLCPAARFPCSKFLLWEWENARTAQCNWFIVSPSSASFLSQDFLLWEEDDYIIHSWDMGNVKHHYLLFSHIIAGPRAERPSTFRWGSICLLTLPGSSLPSECCSWLQGFKKTVHHTCLITLCDKQRQNYKHSNQSSRVNITLHTKCMNLLGFPSLVVAVRLEQRRRLNLKSHRPVFTCVYL